MARIFITGTTDGLGRAAAQALIDEGHQVVLHARSDERASALDDLATRSAGAGAPDDFEQGYLTQTWLAASDHLAAMVSGRYWHHRRTQTPAEQACDSAFQDELSARLAELTGISLF